MPVLLLAGLLICACRPVVAPALDVSTAAIDVLYLLLGCSRRGTS
jgi:hypothetical protein